MKAQKIESDMPDGPIGLGQNCSIYFGSMIMEPEPGQF